MEIIADFCTFHHYISARSFVGIKSQGLSLTFDHIWYISHISQWQYGISESNLDLEDDIMVI